MVFRTMMPESKFKVAVLKVKVAQLRPTFYDPMEDAVHGILQARILECG